MRFLVAVAEPQLRAALRAALVPDHHDIVLAESGTAALELALTCEPDLVVLCTELPEPGGVAVCRELRSVGFRAPILLVSDRRDVPELVSGLEGGADDYLAAPIDARELRARLLALTRRRAAAATGRRLVFADIALDPVARTVHVGGRPAGLTPLEYRILELLMLNPRRVISAETIYDRAWARAPERPGNAVRLYVGYLRRKLERHGSPRVIHTVRGVGYVLREAEPAPG